MGVNPCSQQSRMRKCINTRGSYFCTDESPCSLKEGHTNYYNSSECCKLDFGEDITSAIQGARFDANSDIMR